MPKHLCLQIRKKEIMHVLRTNPGESPLSGNREDMPKHSHLKIRKRTKLISKDGLIVPQYLHSLHLQA
jgi:hypothetical protein